MKTCCATSSTSASDTPKRQASRYTLANSASYSARQARSRSSRDADRSRPTRASVSSRGRSGTPAGGERVRGTSSTWWRERRETISEKMPTRSRRRWPARFGATGPPRRPAGRGIGRSRRKVVRPRSTRRLIERLEPDAGRRDRGHDRLDAQAARALDVERIDPPRGRAGQEAGRNHDPAADLVAEPGHQRAVLQLDPRASPSSWTVGVALEAWMRSDARRAEAPPDLEQPEGRRAGGLRHRAAGRETRGRCRAPVRGRPRARPTRPGSADRAADRPDRPAPRGRRRGGQAATPRAARRSGRQAPRWAADRSARAPAPGHPVSPPETERPGPRRAATHAATARSTRGGSATGGDGSATGGGGSATCGGGSATRGLARPAS